MVFVSGFRLITLIACCLNRQLYLIQRPVVIYERLRLRLQQCIKVTHRLEVFGLLSTAVGSISGTVRDEKGNPAEALVMLSRDLGEETILASRSTNAQPSGSYWFANLPPGKYLIAAFRHEDADLVLRPDGLARFDDLTEGVEVAPAGKVSMDLTIVPSR